MAYLYDLGWRQGSLAAVSLGFSTTCATASGGISEIRDSHDFWVVATQDCDLAAADQSFNEPVVELRPIYRDGKSRPSGIRSRELVLVDSDALFLHAQSPRVMISPAALVASTVRLADVPGNHLTDHELVRLKTWLGKRYDRPAVPEELGKLARNIAAAVQMHRGDEIVRGIRDVLWQGEVAQPPRFSIYAVLSKEADQTRAREWLTAVALEGPVTVGVPDEIEAVPATRISLELIETSYSADVSDVTWQGGGPHGAY